MNTQAGLQGLNGHGRKALDEAIRLVIAEARMEDRVVRAATEARRLGAAHPNSGLSPNEIANVILMAAANAGVAAEMSRAD